MLKVGDYVRHKSTHFSIEKISKYEFVAKVLHIEYSDNGKNNKRPKYCKLEVVSGSRPTGYLCPSEIRWHNMKSLEKLSATEAAIYTLASLGT